MRTYRSRDVPSAARCFTSEARGTCGGRAFASRVVRNVRTFDQRLLISNSVVVCRAPGRAAPLRSAPCAQGALIISSPLHSSPLFSSFSACDSSRNQQHCISSRRVALRCVASHRVASCRVASLLLLLLWAELSISQCGAARIHQFIIHHIASTARARSPRLNPSAPLEIRSAPIPHAMRCDTRDSSRYAAQRSAAHSRL